MVWVLVLGGVLYCLYLIGAANAAAQKRHGARRPGKARNAPRKRPIWVHKDALHPPAVWRDSYIFREIFRRLDMEFTIEYTNGEGETSIRRVTVSDGQGPWLGDITYITGYCHRRKAERTFATRGISRIRLGRGGWEDGRPGEVIADAVCRKAGLVPVSSARGAPS
jgi:hypothetical protein